MNVFKYYKATAAESKKLFSQNRDIINAYNFHILKILLFLSVGICFVLSVLSLIPAITFLYQMKFQVLFSVSLCLFFLFSVVVLFAPDFVNRHSVGAMYVFIVIADAFSVVVCLLIPTYPPYTVTLGFLIIVPMLMMDSRLRIIVVNMSVLVFALILSYYFKQDDYFLTDCINGVAFWRPFQNKQYPLP